MTQGGPTFGFCPAKILRDDPVATDIYTTLVAILETGSWPAAGGIDQQENFWVELVANFGPMRRQMEFAERFNMVAGAFKGSKNTPNQGQGGRSGGSNTRTPPNRNRG